MADIFPNLQSVGTFFFLYSMLKKSLRGKAIQLSKHKTTKSHMYTYTIHYVWQCCEIHSSWDYFPMIMIITKLVIRLFIKRLLSHKYELLVMKHQRPLGGIGVKRKNHVKHL